ncbi:MAG TPA: hypothetical protein VK892_20660, partial [Pyrinomonadaceae bacterium]|nr:hypothetical protein [Pyrinomonadaceae bacterium]
KNRPDLSVSVQSGYIDGKPNAANKQDKKPSEPVETPATQLRGAVWSLVPKRSLSTSVVVNYLDMPNNGGLLSAAVKIETDAAEFIQSGNKQTAEVDLVGFVINSDGKQVGNFSERIAADFRTSDLNKTERADIYYNYQTKLAPGLYQVRVASRDVKSGRVGSAVQWIEIPDLSSKRLALSSLLLGERTENGKPQQESALADSALAGTQISVDRRFSSSSHLRYVIFIYNASSGKNGTTLPNVTLQTHVLRGNNIVMASPERQVSVEGQDSSRLSYAAEILLSNLPSGRYELVVTIQDRAAKTNAQKRVWFEVKKL